MQLPRPSNGPVAGFEAVLKEGQEMPGDKERKGIPRGGKSVCTGIWPRHSVARGHNGRRPGVAEAGVLCTCLCGSVRECECACACECA